MSSEYGILTRDAGGTALVDEFCNLNLMGGKLTEKCLCSRHNIIALKKQIYLFDTAFKF